MSVSRSCGTSQQSLVDNLKSNGIIKSNRVYDAMLSVDRGNFCKQNQYMDKPQGIGYSTTISAPHMHVHTLERFCDQLYDGARVLDVGCGSGYLTACMAVMVGRPGVAIGIDHIGEIVDLAEDNCERNSMVRKLLESETLKFVTGDGRKGHPQEAPYDVIHIGGAIPEIPQTLIDQLRSGGRMIVPVGTKEQKLTQIDKRRDGSVVKTELMGVLYGSLQDRDTQWPRSLRHDDL